MQRWLCFTISWIDYFFDWMINPLIDWLIHWFVDSLNHWFIESLNHWFIDSLIHWFIDPLIHWFIDSSIHRFIDSSIHRFIDSLIHWFIDSLIRWFIDWCKDYLPRLSAATVRSGSLTSSPGNSTRTVIDQDSGWVIIIIKSNIWHPPPFPLSFISI